MANAIDISIVESAAKVIKRDLILSPATLTNSELEKMKVSTITGVTNIESEFVPLTYSGAIRAYNASKTYTDADAKAVAKIIERKLKTYLSCRPIAINMQEFREKEPFPTTDKVDEASLMRLPQTEFTLRQAGIMYGQEVLQAFFNGNRTKGDSDPLGIYDGILTHVAKDMTTYEDEAGNTIPVLISEANGNLIKTDPITKPTTIDDFAAWEVFEGFVEKLDETLLRNPDGVLVIVDIKRAPWIYQAYMNRYPNMQATVKYEEGYKFFSHPEITLVGSALLGDTDTMIATRPGNLHFGIESERSDNNVYITRSSMDPNKASMWIQTSQGTRLLNPTKSHFAINCKQEDAALFEVKVRDYGDLKAE